LPLKPAQESLGHEVRIRKLNSGLHAIAITPDGLEGGALGRVLEGGALGRVLEGGADLWREGAIIL
jgi:gamma-glutamyltranspeptidase/glutathione hydrolase